MLSPDYISELPDQIVKYWQEVEDYIIKDICRRFRKMGEVTGTAELQRLVLQNLGADLTDIDNKIAEALRKSHEEITQLFEEAAAKNQSDYDWMAEQTNQPLEKAVISQITQAAINTAQDDFDNITGTTGFVSRSGQFSLWDQAYRQALSFGSFQVASGATSYTQAAREIINQFAGKGMMIQYASGQRRTVETAVRLCITSGIGRMAKDMAEQNGQMLGADGVEISAHMDSAPDHEPYQGRQYTREAFEALDASLGRPFEIWNCRHIVYPVILDITPPVYTESELRDMAAKNAKGITYDGKHYTMYEASQMQRQIERKIRALKRELIGADAAHDRDLFINLSIKLSAVRQKYVSFSNAAGLPLQHERSQVFGYGRSISAKAVAASKMQLTPANPPSGSGGAQLFPVSGLQASGTQSIISIPGPYGDILRARYDQGTDVAKAVYKKHVPPQGAVSNEHYTPEQAAHFRPRYNDIELNARYDMTNPRGAGSGHFHEHGHYVDHNTGYPSHSKTLDRLIKSDVRAFEKLQQSRGGYRTLIDTRPHIVRDLLAEGQHTTHSIQDIFGGANPQAYLTGYSQMRYQHEVAYWSRSPWRLVEETFANMFEASFSPEQIALMEKYLPNAWQEFNKILEGLK